MSGAGEAPRAGAAPRAWTPRAVYQELRAYDVDPTPCEITLADNTSPFGAPPAALRAIAAGVGDRLAHYPSTYSRALREGIDTVVEPKAKRAPKGAPKKGRLDVETVTIDGKLERAEPPPAEAQDRTEEEA